MPEEKNGESGISRKIWKKKRSRGMKELLEERSKTLDIMMKVKADRELLCRSKTFPRPTRRVKFLSMPFAVPV